MAFSLGKHPMAAESYPGFLQAMKCHGVLVSCVFSWWRVVACTAPGSSAQLWLLGPCRTCTGFQTHQTAALAKGDGQTVLLVLPAPVRCRMESESGVPKRKDLVGLSLYTT